MRQIGYQTVDVFTERRFGGNPLAVMSDARGLAAEEMQAIATEFNWSEVTFVLPPADPAHTAQVRIFTPLTEVPFAGHPNVGTAFVLGRAGAVFGKPAGETMRFEEAAGLVEVGLLRAGETAVGARIRAPRPIELGREIEAEAVAACVGIAPSEIAIGRHRPTVASVGLPFVIAEVGSVETLGRMRTDLAAFAAARDRYRGPGERFSLYVYARTGSARLRARRFSPLGKVPEDPATGSAAAALGGLLATLDRARDASIELAIEQGVEMGRPSRIEVVARKQGGQVGEITVAGRCVPVMHGTLAL